MSGCGELRGWLADRPFPAWILGVAALHATLALISWLAEHSGIGAAWVEACFRSSSQVLLIATAVAEVAAAGFVLAQFEPGEPLRPAWLFLLLAACARLAGGFSTAVLTSPLRELGLLAGGPLHMALLGLGLAFALRVYRRAGLAGRLNLLDRFTFLVGVLFAIQVSLQWPGWTGASHADLGLITRINGSSGPLLSLLLLESLLLRRSATRLNGGLIAECWSAYAAATFLSILADMGSWASVYGKLPAEAGSLAIFLAYPAAAAYALGPSLQATAILRVRQRSADHCLAVNVPS